MRRGVANPPKLMIDMFDTRAARYMMLSACLTAGVLSERSGSHRATASGAKVEKSYG